jgi:predicted nucleic acid-binding protein
MTVVVDASVAVKWLVAEEGTTAARSLFDRPDPLIAPDWLVMEAASTFWKKVQRSELLVVHAERHLRELPEYFSRLYPSAPLVADAFKWAERLRHSPYDCLYLALAKREGCKVVTADARFAARMAAAGLDDSFEFLEEKADR